MGAIPGVLEKDLRNWRQGMEFSTSTKVTGIKPMDGEDEGEWLIETAGDNVKAGKVVVATEGPAANKLVAAGAGAGTYGTPQRSVGCVYYSLKNPPINDPILVLNGCQEKGTEEKPINNMCFPSLVSKTYR